MVYSILTVHFSNKLKIIAAEMQRKYRLNSYKELYLYQLNLHNIVIVCYLCFVGLIWVLNFLKHYAKIWNTTIAKTACLWGFWHIVKNGEMCFYFFKSRHSHQLFESRKSDKYWTFGIFFFLIVPVGLIRGSYLQ